jgi:hypothetical protein
MTNDDNRKVEYCTTTSCFSFNLVHPHPFPKIPSFPIKPKICKAVTARWGVGVGTLEQAQCCKLLNASW